MPGCSYAPPGAGAAYMGMMSHLGPMRESRGPSPYGAASYGMYGGCAGNDTNRRYMQRSDPHPSGYRAPSNSPRGTSLFNSSAPGSRSSQYASQSSYASSYTPRSSYGSSGYRAPSHTPRGSSLFNSSASSSRSPQGSSYAPRSSHASASPSSAGSYSSYNSAKSYLTAYKPRGGWFPGFRNRWIGFGRVFDWLMAL